MAEPVPQEVSILADVNVLAIALTDDHPVHETVFPWLRDGLDGPNTVLVPGPAPLRAQYLMVAEFGVERTAARNAIQSLVRSPARIIGTTGADLLDAYEIRAEKNHDVYDSFLLAMARAHDVEYLLTTDTDFEQLCETEPVQYVNPVPADELDRLSLE